ncbi:50S ribosomal protein L9 [Haploplasma axanthum]|uniref:Large ribosomal subunit protein bL9 n=1 Tax=Haploplasma axanthum TaxID=29552 RepID=A0A449BCP7_HAPAX|nr:50S ribosomal protein L9 [Haploplasma axanthum]VEU80221.1 50S ribosomal protein L9 [Haploplasma axanthum]
MKKFLPILISILVFILTIVFFYTPLQQVFKTDMRAFVGFILVFVADIMLTVVIFLYVNYNQRRRINKLKERLKMWTDLSLYVNKAGDEVFNELPIGVIIYDKDFEIKWTNPYTLEIFNTKKLVDEDIKTISEKLQVIVESKKSKGIIEINSELYDVINRSEEHFIYLFNVTERERIKSKYNNQLPAMGIIYFDNYEESLGNLDVSLQSSIKGEYLAAIDDWLTKYDGYLKPYTGDRIIFMVYRKDLSRMIIDKFDILEKIRSISSKNNVRVTLSIGVASWDVNYDDLGTYAQNAIDLAEKRGGDQAVVNIQNQKIEYFGAKSDASAKSSKVGARVNAQTLKEYIKKASQIFIMGHDQTDLDSFGSMLAVYYMAKIDNKKVYKLYDEDKLDMTVKKVLKEIKTVDPKHTVFENVIDTNKALEINDEETLVIIVDTQSPKIVISKEVLEASKKVIVIDHHRVGDDGFDSIFSYIEPYASSTIELVMELISFYDESIKFTNLEASIMYGGLVLDTNNFTTRTGVRTFEVAYKLRELEADPELVKSWLRKDLDRTLGINKLLSTAKVYLSRFVFMISNEEQEDRVILAQTSEEALSIEGVDAAFTIAPVNGVPSVSARSISGINVQLVMEHIGGGGHINSAAAQIKDKTVDEVYKEIKEFLDMEYGTEGEEMDIILLEDVKGRGKKDDVIKVASGYANFLIKQGKAILANDENVRILRDAQAEEKRKNDEHLELMKKLKADIESKSVTIEIQKGKDGKLFGSVTSKGIAEEFEKQNGILIDRKKIDLPAEINSAGIYTAIVSLHRDVKANIEINVIEKQG